jgi:cytochrome c
VFDEGGPNKVGPNLYNIVNRNVASVADFKYSGALTDHGGAWSYEELNGFLYKPKAWVSGTKMNYAGLKKAEDRANIIAWMRTLSDNPTPLP